MHDVAPDSSQRPPFSCSPIGSPLPVQPHEHGAPRAPPYAIPGLGLVRVDAGRYQLSGGDVYPTATLTARPLRPAPQAGVVPPRILRRRSVALSGRHAHSTGVASPTP